MVHKADLVIIAICLGVASGILIASLVFFGIRWYKRRVHLQHHANERSIATLPIRTNGLETSVDFSASLSNSVAIKISEFPAINSRHSWWSHPSKDHFASASGLPRYSYKDIQKATQNFTTILGEGSFGPVYKATLPAGGVVAVKVLGTNSKQGEKEFFTEVTLLGRLHHRNLVNLVGYCVDKGHRMLIYEFMSNGSLANLLYSEEYTLSWEDRVQIALDISHGVEYLHDGAVPPVIHRDLKTANILLDQSLRAKVADFGLSKEEVFDGRNSGLKDSLVLDVLCTAAMSSDGVDEILDKKLVGTCSLEQVRSLAAIAHKCIHRTPRKRSSMGEISHAILKIRQRHLVNEDSMSFTAYDSSRMTSRIENQQVELRNMASINEREAE